MDDITQVRDIGAELTRRAADHRRIAALCRDPEARAKLEKEADEIAEDAARLRKRTLQ